MSKAIALPLLMAAWPALGAPPADHGQCIAHLKQAYDLAGLLALNIGDTELALPDSVPDGQTIAEIEAARTTMQMAYEAGVAANSSMRAYLNQVAEMCERFRG